MTDYEYTTLEKVQAELRLAVPFTDTTVPSSEDVTTWIKEASASINREGGRVYGETPYSEVFDYGCDRVIVLKNAPLLSVTEVLYSAASLGTDDYSLTEVKTNDKDYTYFKEEGEIELLPAWHPTPGLKKIKVNYIAGFEEIPADIVAYCTKSVAKRALDTQLNKDVNEKKSGKSVSVGSISIVKPADFGVSQYKVLSDDVMSMKHSLLNGTSAYRIPLNRYA